MAIKKSTIERIRRIIEKQHSKLLINILGPEAFDSKELAALKRGGVSVKDTDSLIERLYNHNYLNPENTKNTPNSLEEMKQQQERTTNIPSNDIHEASKEYLNGNFKQLIEKQKADVLFRLESILRDYNNSTKLKDQGLEEILDEEGLNQLKTRFKDASGDFTRNWDRIVNTEVSNAVSLGSVDRIVDENKDENFKEVYVYRIAVQDAKTCAECRKFYIDKDGSPKVYKLSTLLGNGSNFGKKRSEWEPVATATHPNERCSQVIELRKGWKVLPGGSVEFIGPEAFIQYIIKKVID